MKRWLLLLCLLMAIPAQPAFAGYGLKSLKKKAKKVAKKLPKPTATIKDVDLVGISFEDIDFLFLVSIKNPYPIGINLDKVTFDFAVEGHKLFSTTTRGGLKLKPKASSDTRLNVNLTYNTIINAVRDYSRKAHVELSITGNIVILVPNHKKLKGVPRSFTFPFKLKKKIPAIKPKLSIENFRVQEPDISSIEAAMKKAKKKANAKTVKNMFGALLSGKAPKENPLDPKDLDLKFKLTFDIHLANETVSKLNFQSLDYEFHLNGSKLVTGASADIRSIKNVAVIRVVNEFSSRSLSKAVLSAFKEKKGTFVVHGNTKLQLPPSLKKTPLKLEFKQTGSFSL